MRLYLDNCCLQRPLDDQTQPLSIQPMSELTSRAKNALVQELGVVDAMRFLNQFRAGNGDYTIEREQLLRNESVKSIAAGIKAQRNSRT